MSFVLSLSFACSFPLFSVVSPTSADEGPSRIRVSDDDARPIWTDRQVTDRGSSEVSRIRWQPDRVSRSGSTGVSKTRPTVSAARSSIPVVTMRPAAVVSEPSAMEVRQASRTESADPFQDPFGDRTSSRARPSARRDSLTLNSAGFQPNLVPDDAGSDAQPMPESQAEPNRGELLPDQAAENGCDRKYNQVNCCDAEKECDRIRQAIQNDSITRVLLDITPRYKPDAESIDEEVSARTDVLSKAESRTWRNRDGRILAIGKFIDYAQGKIVVAPDAGGESVELPYGELSEDDICFVTAWWRLPTECTLSEEQFAMREFTPMTFTFHASGTCHKPLYFEDVQLERYGHTTGPILQPWLSGAHFFGNVLAFPYRLGIHPLTECQYPLGHYRPGNCAPWMVPPIPISLRGGLYAGGLYTGLPFIIP